MNNFEFETFFKPYKDLIWKTGKSRYFFYEYIIKKLNNSPIIDCCNVKV